MTPAADEQSDTGTTNTTNQNRFADASPGSETTIGAPILRAIFRKFPQEIQLDYARHHDLPNADKLTSGKICASLFYERDSIPALEVPGHIRYPTKEGLFIVKDVMDLVDWLVECTPGVVMLVQTPDEDMEGDETAVLPEQQDHLDAIPLDSQDGSAEDNFEKMAGKLELAQGHVKAAIEESQRVTREACADIFILQGQLTQANACHVEIVKAFANIVGLEAMQKIEDKVDVAMREGDILEREKFEKLHSRASIHHVIPGAQHATDKRNVGLSSHHGTRLNTSRIRRGTKRVREDVDDMQAGDPGSSSLTSPPENSPYQRHKRPRLRESSAVVDALPAQTILNYPSDEGSEGDSSYSDSNGSERDFLDDHYSFIDSRGWRPEWDLLSSEILPNSSDGDDSAYRDERIEWKSDDEDCFSDADYQPPEWDMEDIFELEQSTSQNPFRTLFASRYIDELIEGGGFLSEGGLSTDDSEKGTWTREMLQRRASSARKFPNSLNPLLGYPTDRDEWKYDRSGRLHDEETYQAIRKSQISQGKWVEWLILQNCLANYKTHFPEWMELDVEKRLDEIVSSDHAHYYVDNEEWKYFEDPSCWDSS